MKIKRIVSILICLCMVFVLLPGTALASVTADSAALLADALNGQTPNSASFNGNVVTLAGSVELRETIDITGGSTTLNLNGHSITQLTAGKPAFRLNNASSLIVTDSSAGTHGTIAGGGIGIALSGNSSLTLDGVTVTGGNGTIGVIGNPAVYMSTTGAVTATNSIINGGGGTVNAAGAGVYATDGSFTATDTQIRGGTGNEGTGADGVDGVYGGDGISMQGSSSVTLYGGSVTGGNGGGNASHRSNGGPGISMDTTGRLAMTGSTISGGAASARSNGGAGIYIGNTGGIDISGGSVTGGDGDLASGYGGDGVYVGSTLGNAQITARACDFAGGEGVTYSGSTAVFMDDVCKLLTLDRCIFTPNSSTDNYTVLLRGSTMPGEPEYSYRLSKTDAFTAISEGVALSPAEGSFLQSAMGGQLVLSEAGEYTFPSAVVGYAVQAALNVTVANISLDATGEIDVSLSGTNAGVFTVSPATLESLDPGEADGGFTVTPSTGLPMGTYTATVTASAGSLSASFDVSFTVTAATPPAPSGDDYILSTPVTVYNDISIPNATIWLTGNGLQASDLLVTERLTSGGDYSAMLSLADEDDVFRVYNIYLKSGMRSTGSAMYLNFDLADKYAGRAFTLAHKLSDGTYEYFYATADAKGDLKFGPLLGLSPFMLVKGTLSPDAITPPQTGDSAVSWLVAGIALMACVAIYGAVTVARRKRV